MTHNERVPVAQGGAVEKSADGRVDVFGEPVSPEHAAAVHALEEFRKSSTTSPHEAEKNPDLKLWGQEAYAKEDNRLMDEEQGYRMRAKEERERNSGNITS